MLQSTRRVIIDLFYLAIFLSIFYAIWIGSHALFTPDEGRYSEIAREMVATGDYITPRLNGVVFLDKPILYYWLQASAIKLFGIQEWALRAWPSIVGVIGCLVTYIAGSLLFNRRTGLMAAIILATCPLYYGAAHYANLDLEVAVFVGSALSLFIAAIHLSATRLRSVLLFSAYVFAGLAALTKGLIGIVFPCMIIGVWILLLNRWKVLKEMRLLAGLLIFAMITVPWYVLVQKANPEFFQFFFLKQQVSRFLTTEQFNNRTPVWFYLPIVLGGIFPWSVFLIQALVMNIKKIIQHYRDHAAELYLVLWLFLIFIFFSVPKSKTVGYILPIFPAISLLVANYLNDYWDKIKSAGFRLGLFVYLCFSAVFCIAGVISPYIKQIHAQVVPYLQINAVLFFISSLIVIYFWLTKKTFSRFFTVFAATGIAFMLLVSASSQAINQKSIKPLAMQLKPALQPNDEVVTFYKYFQDLPIYLQRRITIVTDWHAPDIAENDNWVRELWYGMPYQDTRAWLIEEDEFWKRWESGKRLFVLTDVHYFKEIQKKSKSSVYKIGQYNQVVLITNTL